LANEEKAIEDTISYASEGYLIFLFGESRLCASGDSSLEEAAARREISEAEGCHLAERSLSHVREAKYYQSYSES